MKIALLLFTFLSINIYSQKNSENNEPIIFFEFILGGAGEINGKGGIIFGSELNYQINNSILSIRYIEHNQLESGAMFLSPFTAFPIIEEKNKHKEYGLLYGRRWIYNGSSLSISGGISLNHYLNIITSENNERFKEKDNYLGFPLELNFKWFRTNKKRYRVFGIFPVGKPTSFGGNFGFKLIGNISKNSFVGVGLVFGLGIHKKY